MSAVREKHDTLRLKICRIQISAPFQVAADDVQKRPALVGRQRPVIAVDHGRNVERLGQGKLQIVLHKIADGQPLLHCRPPCVRYGAARDVHPGHPIAAARELLRIQPGAAAQIEQRRELFGRDNVFDPCRRPFDERRRAACALMRRIEVRFEQLCGNVLVVPERAVRACIERRLFEMAEKVLVHPSLSRFLHYITQFFS